MFKPCPYCTAPLNEQTLRANVPQGLFRCPQCNKRVNLQFNGLGDPPDWEVIRPDDDMEDTAEHIPLTPKYPLPV